MWIQTYTGKRFPLLFPQVEDICIEDIAHALSNLCRYTGHVIEYFSVAQHSVLVSSVLPDKLKLCGLMHDSAEAYVGDLSSPLKALVMEYISIEHVILKKIAEKYVFSYPFPPEIKLADTQLLLAEKAVLFKDDMQWREEFCIQRLDIEIVPLPPKEAEKAFLDAFSALTRY